jgi:hypothetical protein
LCPPCTPDEAALVARAALIDTLGAASGTRARRVILALDGRSGDWLPPGIEVIVQRGGGLDQRIAAAFEDVAEPALLIGMDTPQVTARLLDAALDALMRPGIDAVLGFAADGGWWAAGLRGPDLRAFVGVPMSTPRTGHAQAQRLGSLGLRCELLPVVRDVDTFADAIAVAAEAPGSRFAAEVTALPASQLAG